MRQRGSVAAWQRGIVGVWLIPIRTKISNAPEQLQLQPPLTPFPPISNTVEQDTIFY